MSKKLQIDIQDYLRSKDIKHSKVGSNGFITLEECPFCKKKKKMGVLLSGKPGKASKGFYNCFSGSCQAKGGFEGLISHIEGIELSEAIKVAYGRASLRNFQESENYSIEFSGVSRPKLDLGLDQYQLPTLFEEVSGGSDAASYLENRGLSLEESKELGCGEIPLREMDKFFDLVKNNYSEKIQSIISTIYKKRLKIDETIFTNELGEHDDVETARSLVESSFLIGRVIFPCTVFGVNYGYVARDYTGNTNAPKVRNSYGSFSSKIVWNFDNVLRSDELVITEGIFDAVKTGIHRSVALLGKNISPGSEQIKLLKQLRPNKIFIALDSGAESDSLKLAKLLSSKAETYIVEYPKVLTIKEGDTKDNILNLLEKLKIPATTDSLGIEIMPFNFFSAKVFNHFITHRSFKLMSAIVKNSKFSDFHKRRLLMRVNKLPRLSDEEKDILLALRGLDYVDAGDLSKEENQALISNARAFDEGLYLNKFNLLNKQS